MQKNSHQYFTVSGGASRNITVNQNEPGDERENGVGFLGESEVWDGGGFYCFKVAPPPFKCAILLRKCILNTAMLMRYELDRMEGGGWGCELQSSIAPMGKRKSITQLDVQNGDKKEGMKQRSL